MQPHHWVIVAVVGWPLLSVGVALLVGAFIRAGRRLDDEREGTRW